LLFSFTESSGLSKIEFLAVDSHCQGLGIGKSLFQAMEHFLCQKKVDRIIVGTQLNNIEGIRFYVSCGFRLIECNSIYHYWPLRP
jgi:dTDP-4-amino-4,6-dideoxy-D-galactose acyltransferase